MDGKVQAYIKASRDHGCVVNTAVTVAAAKGIIMKTNRMLLEENGGPIALTKSPAKSLLYQMGFVKRRGSTKVRLTPENFESVRATYLEQIRTTVEFEEIPQEVIFNWDQTGLNYVKASSWTMEKEGAKRVEIGGLNDKTAVFAATVTGEFLPVQLVYQGKTNPCHPRVCFPEEWHITHSPNHWSNETTMIDYITKIIVPFTEKKRRELHVPNDQAALAIFDEFKGQLTEKCTELLLENNILIVRVPPNCTDRLQPLDISVNNAAKDFLKHKFQEWYSEQIFRQLD